MNQDLIEKNYYEQLMVGQYLEAKYSEQEWKICKLIDKDKKYAVVSFEGINTKEEVALKSFSKSISMVIRQLLFGFIQKDIQGRFIVHTDLNILLWISIKMQIQLIQHLEILQQTYLKDPLPSAFTSTQYIRGDLFVIIHTLLTRQDLKEEEYNEAMKFFLGFIQFVVKFAKKVKKMASQYFQSLGANKYTYLINDKVAYVNCLNQLLIILNLLIKAENSKHTILLRNKQINQDVLIKFFMELKQINTFADLFKINDGNGKWLSFNIHKHLYFLLKKYEQKLILPDYKIRDYQEVFSFYPFLMKTQEKENQVQEKYILFCVNCLKEQCSFETKLKAIQELKKIIEGDIKLFQLEEKHIYSLISQQGVIDHMLSQYHFNPEIFKRFTPILQNYCKFKSLSMKNIGNVIKYSSLYLRLTKNRHESQVNVIYEILCILAEFVQTDALDFMYGQILKFPLNNQQTIKLIKDFTINAIINYSKQKSFLSSLFKKTKNSSKYGYYGLDLIFKQIQDEGAIDKNHLQLGFEAVKDIFSVEIFQGERSNYLSICLGWLEKIKNYGQSLKLIDIILATFPSSTFFSDTQKNLIDKLVSKNNLLNLAIFGIKYRQKINETKISLPDIIKFLYSFLQNYYDLLIPYIKIEHIQFLWTLNENKLLSSFLKKSKTSETKKKDFRQKHIKKIPESVQEQILTKLTRKTQFYQRKLTIEEFQALDQIFVSFNILKKKLDISELGFLRYFTPELEGYAFYFAFLKNMIESIHIDKIIRKTIIIFLRAKDQKEIQTRANTWLMCLLKMVEKLKTHPEVCLKAINIFFQFIQGKLAKPNISCQGNIDIIVTHDTEKKVINLSKNCTIFKLRKQIMEDFNLPNDFTLHSLDMRRDITFQEEQEYSLNALINSSNIDKGPSVKIVGKKKEKHPQMQAIQRFKEIIEKEEKFYSMLFQLNNDKVHEVFWKTVELLPVNRQLIRKIQNCANFTQKEWSKLLKSQTVESLQYHLNIIHEIMEKNSKWVAVFSSSGGLATIIELLAHKLKDEQIVIERIVNRCILIVVHVLDTVSKIEDQLLDELKLTLIAKLIEIFKGQLSTVTIGIESLNNMFHLLKQINKIYKKQDTKIDLEILLKILQYGVFKPKNKTNLEFIEKDFEHYLINNYNSQQEKIIIYQKLLSFLNIQFISTKDNSELMFTFLIDFMNTFVLQQSELVSKTKYLSIIESFVMKILTDDYSDPSKQIYNHLLLGAFKLLNFTLNYSSHSYDQKLIFNILMKDFLFCKEKRKIKHEITLKVLYESIKKILFNQQDLINVLIEEIAPQLRKNEWRKNLYSNWCLESKKQERNIYCGLQNLGATCYINCLLQQLFMISHFRQNFMSIDSRNYRPLAADNEIIQLQSIFSGLKYSNRRSINTKKFCQSFITYEGVPINPVVQSDADEFLNQLMEKIEAFLKDNHRHDIIENTFQGKLSNQLNCQECPHNSEKEDHFFSLGVNIRGKKTLEEALEGFVQGQILDGDNAYFCQICQKKVRTQKRLCVKTLPNILTIVIKRFEFNYDQMRKIKINSYLKFPFELNMKKYTTQYLGGSEDLPDQPYCYRLRGAVIHSGTSQGGHYYSFINSENKWYSFNDQFIEQIKTSRIQEEGFGGQDKSIEGDFKFEKYKNAYILFYEKEKPSESYHEIEGNIENDFNKELQKEVKTENSNADFLSVMLDSNFIRLCQNFCAIQRPQAYEFSLLYFHTVVLRDRFKDDHIPNYYRILDSLLSKQVVSFWYLSQINHQFIKEFLIESPRTTKFTCTSLILKALSVVKEIPKTFVGHCIIALRKTGMTPFAKIFTKLSKIQETKGQLILHQYSERVINLLLDKSNENYNMMKVESFESYFGTDSSEKQKDRQSCFSSLCESLEGFDLPFLETYQIFQKYSSREGSKALARVLASKIEPEQLSTILISLQSIILKDAEFKKEELEKYFFFIRAVCLSAQDNTEWKIEKCIYSLKKMVYECRIYYQPMETLLRELNYIASRSTLFFKRWRTAVMEMQNSYDMIKTLKYWLKEAERPQYLYKSEDFKRKVASLSFEEKNQIQIKNKYIQEKRLNWMVEKETKETQFYDSDIEEGGLSKEILIRNKKFKIKEHLGLIKKIEMDGNQRWGFLEKNDFDLYHSL